MACVEVKNVSLIYPIYGASARSFKSTLFNIATGGRLARDRGGITVKALTGVSFKLEKGDRLAVLGHNGAGKSTLLKVLANIYEPSEGIVNVQGRVSCLFDIMMGMDEELNGYENIALRGVVLGLSRREVQKIVPQVEAFAELGEYMHVPIKSYSSGMKVRLAFGIITHVFSEILLIDEIVNVGDARFLAKAKTQMLNLIHASDFMVLSTHDVNIVRELCNKALWLDKGSLKCFGEAEKVLETYQREQA
jgi:ABC-type polysaccharide/polyol phosphate transport system ATPase subunit